MLIVGLLSLSTSASRDCLEVVLEYFSYFQEDVFENTLVNYSFQSFHIY